MTALARLRAEIERSTHVGAVAVSLLVYCRANKSELHSVVQSARDQRGLDSEARSAIAWVGAAADYVSPAVRARLLATLAASERPPVTARALAVAISTVCGQALPNYLADRDPRVCLAEGVPYATPMLDLPKLVPTRGPFTTSAVDRPDTWGVDGLPTLRLATGAMRSPIQVVLDHTAGAALDRAMDETPLVLGAAFLNPTIEDFGAPGISGDAFFGVPLADPNGQIQTVASVLRAAAITGVSALVLPELCRDDLCSEKILDAVMAAGSPGVVLAGTQHISLEDRRLNRGHVLYPPDGPVVVQDKLSRARLRLPGPPQGPKYREDIDCGTELVVHAGRRWSMVTLTCADLLDSTIIQLVCDLRPNLVLVSAMSDKMSGFETGVTQILNETQAFAVVANNVGDWGNGPVPPSLFGRPLVSGMLSSLDPEPEAGLGVLASDDDMPRWITA